MILKADFAPALRIRNNHVQTLLPTLFRRIPLPPYRRERLELPDGDFLDLDWLKSNHESLVILTHGLEGCSGSVYIRGMVSQLQEYSLDILAWNLRGCSGEPNRLPNCYHSGKSEDLRRVIEYVISLKRYRQIALIGFSIGGNITLKYLGEEGPQVPSAICCAVAISVPCDLAGSAKAIAHPRNVVYMQRFLINLRRKVRVKAALFPDVLSTDQLKGVRTFYEFDERYTAPLNGFPSAKVYWAKSSCLPILPQIRTPSLLINALDDSFLGASCYPFSTAENNPYFHFAAPHAGGHVGFIQKNINGPYWSEIQALHFMNRHLELKGIRHQA